MTSTDNETFSVKITLLYILVGFVIYILSNFLSSIIFDLLYTFVFKKTPLIVIYISRNIGSIILTYVAFYFLIKKIVKKDLAFFRITPVKIKPVFIIAGILLPGLVIAFTYFTGDFSVNSDRKSILISMILLSIFTSLEAGMLEELVFRGYIMKLLEEKWGKIIAIFVPSVLFASLHFLGRGKFDILSVFQLLIAGTLVGTMFSVVALNNGSIWASVFMHAFWNATIIGDVLNIAPEKSAETLFNIQLTSDNPLITGGHFGVESSLVAIIGYALIVAGTILVPRLKTQLSKHKNFKLN